MVILLGIQSGTAPQGILQPLRCGKLGVVDLYGKICSQEGLVVFATRAVLARDILLDESKL